MKRIFTLMLTLIVIALLLVCCAKDEVDENGQDYFNAKVLEVCDSSILAECTDKGQSGMSVGGQVFISRETIAADGFPEVTVGDEIRVVFDGEIMETDPAQINTPFAVYVVD